MHLVQANGMTLLLDCGLFQGKRAEARQRNSSFPFRPETIDAVILSHAHIDHCGNLPNLVRQGFSGPIFCTPATHDLAAIMLADSAKIQEEDADYLNRKLRPGEPRIEPLYTRKDAHRTMRFSQPVHYDKAYDLGEHIQLRFVDAGHLLGSAMVHLSFESSGRSRTLSFTGDLGRRGLPILRDPASVPAAEFVISESTYGGRTHPPIDLLTDSLSQVVQRTVDRGGKLIVPAFSVGRTQNLLYCLFKLIDRGELRGLPIYVDSPLAANATEVFRLHPECFDEETFVMFEEHPDLFGERRVQYVRNVNESKALNGRKDPCIIIAASGMCESGRIVHHLKYNIEDARNTIAIIGYQAPETLGRRIVEKKPEVRIHGGFFKLRAEVAILNGFSSHADHPELLSFLTPLASTARQMCLVHGEVSSSEALAQGLKDHGVAGVTIPDRGQSLSLD
jgi:metallo-beta-lactamase family protein